MKQIYIIGDVHGCYNTLLELVKQLPPHAHLVFVGDLIDRGPHSKEVIQYVRQHGHDVVLGNHEDMLIDCDGKLRDERGNYTDWGANGGDACLDSYNSLEELQEDIEWLKTLPRLIFIDEAQDKMGRSLVVSHAPVLDYMEYYLHIMNRINEKDYTPHELIDFEHTISNSEMMMIWNRNIPKKQQTNYFNVFGHTPIDSFIFDRYGEYKLDNTLITKDNVVIDKLKGYANIDTGACYIDERSSKIYRGKLTALEFPSMKVFQQENIDGF